MTKQNRYGLKFRPASIGAVPAGNFSIEPANPSESIDARHGVIIYERELTDDEVYRYELVLLPNEQQLSVFVMEVAVAMADYAEAIIDRFKDDKAALTEYVIRFTKNIRTYRIHIGNVADFTQKVYEKICSMHSQDVAAIF